MRRIREWAATALLTTLVGLPVAAGAEESSLREVMRGLGGQMGRLGTAIMAGDLPAQAQAASAIAGHPKPAAAEMHRIEQRLGDAMEQFEAADEAVHAAAAALAQAANRRDNAQAVRQYHRLIDGCVACHDSFRARVRPAGEKSKE